MKRILLLAMAFILVLSACGNGAKEEASKTQDDGATGEESQDEQGVEVEKGLFDVTITIPASFFEDGLLDAADQESKEVVQNEDGSITYKMSKSEHKEFLAEMREDMEQSFKDISNDDDFPSINDITYNKDFTELTMIVEREVFENSFDGFASIGLAFSAAFYQIFTGADAEKINITIHLQDADTGEIFETTDFPDAFDGWEDFED